MQRSLTFSGINLFCILMLIFPLDAYSQTDHADSLKIADTLKLAPEVSRHSFYMGIGYGSNMFFLGSTLSHNQPFGYTAISYGFNNEFYATVSAIHLADIDPFMAFYTGSLNYNHAFNSWFDISSGIYRYQAPAALADTLLSNLTYGDLTLGIDWRLLYSKISAGVLLSSENQTYFQLRNSRYFQTPEFTKKKFFISFDPYVNLLIGSRYTMKTTTETYSSSSPTGNTMGSNNQNSATTADPAGTITTTSTTLSRDFGMMEIDFGLPVTFNSDRISIEAEASYVLPLHNDSYLPGPKGFVFIISGFIRIF